MSCLDYPRVHFNGIDLGDEDTVVRKRDRIIAALQANPRSPGYMPVSRVRKQDPPRKGSR